MWQNKIIFEKKLCDAVILMDGRRRGRKRKRKKEKGKRKERKRKRKRKSTRKNELVVESNYQ